MWTETQCFAGDRAISVGSFARFRDDFVGFGLGFGQEWEIWEGCWIGEVDRSVGRVCGHEGVRSLGVDRSIQNKRTLSALDFQGAGVGHRRDSTQ